MLLRYYSQFDGQPAVANVRGNRVRVGSAQSNDITLPSKFVDDFAFELRRLAEGWQIKTIGLNGCEGNGRKLTSGEEVLWDGASRVSVFPYIFQIHADEQVVAEAARRYTDEIHQLVKLVHLDILQQMHFNGSTDDIPKTTEQLLHVERAIESSAAQHGVMLEDFNEVATELAGVCVRDELLNLLLERDTQIADSPWLSQFSWSNLVTVVPDREEELHRLTMGFTRRLYENLEDDSVTGRVERLERSFWQYWDGWRAKLGKSMRDYLALKHLKKHVKDTLFGFGPLEDLLRMPIISEIMVNSSQEIFIEKQGVLQNSGRQFVSDDVTSAVIQRIVDRVGRQINTSQPMVDARLPDGSRVNAVLPPLAVKGPCLTVRKFAHQRFTMAKLIEIGALSTQVAEFLQGCVRSQRSILVSGGTGTGKTTLLNCLSQAIPIRERIICIEDTHELQLDHPHVVFLECRDGNNEAKGKVVIRDLLKNALRQRPDRLIVGECRSDEALDMLQAMNTGHDGSMTTIHANTPADSLRRLEVLVRDSGLPSDAIRQQIVSAIDIVVQLTRSHDGRRCVTEVAEVEGFDDVNNRIRLRTLFETRFSESEGLSRLVPTGCIPTFACELVRKKHIQLELFLQGVSLG